MLRSRKPDMEDTSLPRGAGSGVATHAAKGDRDACDDGSTSDMTTLTVAHSPDVNHF